MTGTECQIARAVAEVPNPNPAWWATQTDWLLTAPMTGIPAAGSTLSIVRGCAKTRDVATGDRQGDCAAVFANLLRLGGFPDAPKSTG
jgi:hypothetical protein